MSIRIRHLLGAAVVGALASFAAPGLASAASFNCNSAAGFGDDTHFQSMSLTSGNCFIRSTPPDVLTPRGIGSSREGVVAAGAVVNHPAGASSAFISANGVGELIDELMVSGLGAQGALLTFNVFVGGSVNVYADLGTPFGLAATASNAFSYSFSNNTTGMGVADVIDTCARNASSIISTCNGVFDAPVDVHASFGGIVPLSVFAHNGDSLRLVLRAQASALSYTVTSLPLADAVASVNVIWRGLQAAPGLAGVTVVGQTGYDYAQLASAPGVPEPATWAVMILGFGGAGAALRRRRPVALVR